MTSEFQPLVPYFVNFAIMVGLAYWFGRGPVRKIVYQRHERMRDALDSAASAHKQATERELGARRAIQRLQEEEGALIQKERLSAQQEEKELLEKASAEADRVAREAERLALAEAEETSERVKAEFLASILGEAEDRMRKGLKKDDHSAILKRAQSSIEVGV